MSADGALNATGYIRHHLANLASAHQSSIVDFSVINYDTLFFSIAIMAALQGGSQGYCRRPRQVPVCHRNAGGICE